MTNREPCCPDLAACLRSDLFRALSDPTRLELLARLARAREPLTVTGVADCCGIHLSGVSRHLAVLREAGIVTGEKKGREMRYRLRHAGLAGSLRALADAIESCCPPEKEM